MRAGELGARKGLQRRDCEPRVEGRLIIDVAVGAVVDALGPEGGETGVEVLAHLAEVLVAGVTETTDGEFHPGELRHRASLMNVLVVRRRRCIRRVAFTPGAHDDEEVLGFGQSGGFCVAHAGTMAVTLKSGFSAVFAMRPASFSEFPDSDAVKHGQLAFRGGGNRRRQGAHRRVPESAGKRNRRARGPGRARDRSPTGWRAAVARAAGGKSLGEAV
jgi:hypothetical protein